MPKIHCKFTFFIFLLTAFLISCNKPMNAQEKNKVVKQGVAGRLLWLEGNLMPSIEGGGNNAAGQPVQREVHIYEATKMSEATQTENFYNNIQTKLVKVVMSEKNGFFKASLEPGQYSLFVKEPKGLFANIFDAYGYIMPVEVIEDEVTEVTININYMAAY